MFTHSQKSRRRAQIYSREQGFSLVELLVAMVVGLVIVGGAFSLHSGTRKTQVKNEEQMDMVADARFAIELIAYDLRHAGMWGGTNKDSLIDCRSSHTGCVQSAAGEGLPNAVTGDCEAGWYYDLSEPVVGVTSNVTKYANCVSNRKSGTDMLTVRYADSNQQGVLAKGQVYVRSNFMNGRVFVGDTQPELDAYDTDPLTQNHELHSNLYYISTYSDAVGDGIPALRRSSLVNGPAIEDQLLISGVHDLQVAFGEDVDGDQSIDRYADPSDVSDWSNVYAAKIWMVMRSDKKQTGNITTTKTFTIDGVQSTYGADGYRYFMVSTVVDLRNLRQI
jgi:type IV pilus assembly protein PilW